MSRKTNFKRDKMQEKILNSMNSLLRQSIHDDRLTFVSITRVDLNVDYSKAEIFWDTFSPDKKASAELGFKENRGRLRSELAKALQIRAVPEIDFHYDSQFEDEQHITDLIKKAQSSEGDEE